MAQIDITEADLANAILEQWEEDATEALSKLQSVLNKSKEEGSQLTEEECFARIKVILDQWKEEDPLSHLTEEECFARIKAILEQWKKEDEENAKLEASKQEYGYVIYDGKT